MKTNVKNAGPVSAPEEDAGVSRAPELQSETRSPGSVGHGWYLLQL